MDLQPVLEGDLVQMRPLIADDLEPLYEVARDPLIWEQHPAKRYLRSEFVSYFQESIKSSGALTILDKKINKVIGSSRYKKLDGLTDGLEIGWTFLDRKYWGGKYNREVKNLMIDHAFKYVDRVIFLIDEQNFRSRRAVEKIKGRRLDPSESSSLLKTNPEKLVYLIEKPK